MEFLSFVFATFSLLAIPAPTNSLLAASGAGVGVSRSLHLLGAELAGYLTAIVTVRFGLAPLATSVPLAGVVLRAAVIVYLIYLACLLWRSSSRELWNATPVTFKAVLLTTLVNPKATILAFLSLPSQIGLIEVMPWLAAMAAQVVAAGAAWLALGATLGRGLRDFGRPELVCRLSAVVLVIMATAMSAQTLRSA
jgi:threonine/homoserine/homoserine lactone efflux protein